MKRICAWCNKLLGYNKYGTPEQETHGICKECVINLDKEWREKTQ